MNKKRFTLIIITLLLMVGVLLVKHSEEKTPEREIVDPIPYTMGNLA